MTVTEAKEAGFLEVTKTRKVSGAKWYADAENDCWWNHEMTACIVKVNSRRFDLCDSNMNMKVICDTFKEAAGMA